MADKAIQEKQSQDEIIGLTLAQAKALADYLKEAHGIEAAGGGIKAGEVGAAADSEIEKPKFDVVLTDCGTNKIAVIKAVRACTGLGLQEVTDLVGSLPKPLKTAISIEESRKLKELIEHAGGRVTIDGDFSPDALVLSPPRTSTAPAGEWTDKLNARRVELLLLGYQRPLNASENHELEGLQSQCAAFLDEKAPLPFEKLSQLEEEVGRLNSEHAS